MSGLQPPVLDDAEIARVLVVQAHPDDVDFAAAGTIATWVDAGIEVTYGICTDGQAGGFDPDIPRAELPRIRRAEQRAAARELGVHDVRFLGYVDGELAVTTALVEDLTRLIRQVRPDRMLIPSPERNWARIQASHPDHLATGEAALQALYPAARNPFAFPRLADAGLDPWTVREVWLGAHPDPNHYVDVTKTFDRKVAAICAHTSQLPDVDSTRLRVRSSLQNHAAAAGFASDRLAEAFFVARTE